MSTPHKPHPKDPAATPKAMGMGMVVGAWLVIMTVGVLAFQNWFNRASNPNSDPFSSTDSAGRIHVELEINRQGHYVADGMVNDERVRFLLDTGATTVAVPPGIAERAGLPRGARISLNTANGVSHGFLTRIDTVTLGDIELHDISGVVAPGLPDNEVLLGMSFLKHLDWRQAGSKLVLATR